MSKFNLENQDTGHSVRFPMKLWIYTNYDCNLRCKYCVAESSPRTLRRAIDPDTVEKIVDQVLELGIEHVYFTGGEPFILDDIYGMLAYSAARVPTTILTNAMLFRGKRLQNLKAIPRDNITIQVSLDGSHPKHHDPYRGKGSWQKTIEGIRTLQELDFSVRISTTETPANAAYIDEICAFRRSMGIADEDHLIRPLAKRGFSNEGLEVSKQSLVPELTINAEGVYWHPLSTDPDLLISKQILPLSSALSQAREAFAAISGANDAEMQEFQ